MRPVRRIKLEYTYFPCLTIRGSTVYVKLIANALSSNWRTTGVKVVRFETFNRQTLVIPNNSEGNRLLQVLKASIVRVRQEQQLLRVGRVLSSTGSSRHAPIRVIKQRNLFTFQTLLPMQRLVFSISSVCRL